MSLQSRLAKYPKKKGEWSENRLHSDVPCVQCKAVIRKTDRVYTMTEQVDFFRGNDEVGFFCVECAKAMGQVVPPTAHERKLANVTIELNRAKDRLSKFGESSETGRRALKCINRCEKSLAALAKEHTK